MGERRRNLFEKERFKDPKVAVGLSYYNDMPCIRRHVDSLIIDSELQPDMLIAGDGRYRGYPDATKLSIDGSRNVIDRLKLDFFERVVHVSLPDMLERNKRQALANIAAQQGMDFMLIIDADEFISYPESHWSTFRMELMHIKAYGTGHVYGIPCVDLHEGGSTGFRPRLWFRPEEMQYMKNHYQFKVRGTDKVEYIHRNVDSLVIHHDRRCRPEQREELRKEYQSNLRSLED
jgi:hypothetical protein